MLIQVYLTTNLSNYLKFKHILKYTKLDRLRRGIFYVKGTNESSDERLQCSI